MRILMLTLALSGSVLAACTKPGMFGERTARPAGVMANCPSDDQQREARRRGYRWSEVYLVRGQDVRRVSVEVGSLLHDAGAVMTRDESSGNILSLVLRFPHHGGLQLRMEPIDSQGALWRILAYGQ